VFLFGEERGRSKAEVGFQLATEDSNANAPVCNLTGANARRRRGLGAERWSVGVDALEDICHLYGFPNGLSWVWAQATAIRVV
jgi:hypothetical protein